MRKSNQHAIRALLREHPEGLLIKQMTATVGTNASSVLVSLRSMPDAYIAHWVHTGGRGPAAALWRVVQVPPHCPRPAAMN